MYDYLVVGSGLFGAIFAHEAKKREREFLLLKREHMWPEISIRKKWRELMFINMVRISSTRITRKFGII